MSMNKAKYFVVSHVVKANNKGEAARALAHKRNADGQLVYTKEPMVERISAVEAKAWV